MPPLVEGTDAIVSTLRIRPRKSASSHHNLNNILAPSTPSSIPNLSFWIWFNFPAPSHPIPNTQRLASALWVCSVKFKGWLRLEAMVRHVLWFLSRTFVGRASQSCGSVGSGRQYFVPASHSGKAPFVFLPSFLSSRSLQPIIVQCSFST